MNTKFFNSHELNFSQYISLLFEATVDGILTIPRFEDNSLEQGPDYKESFIMNWLEEDIEKITSDVENLISDIKTLSSMSVETDDGYIADVRGNDEFYAIWKKYISSLDDESIDRERFCDICERMDGDDLSDEEWEYYDSVMGKRVKRAEERIGGKVYCYDVVNRAQRLYKLLILKAPNMIINNESNKLAEALVLNTYGDSKK